MITKERLSGNWHSVVGALKEKFGDFTSDELSRVEGKFDELVGLVQRKSGQSKEEISKFISNCVNGSSRTLNRAAETVSEYTEAAGEVLKDNYDRVASEAQKGYDYTMQSVSKRPMESVAIAVGAGFLAGVALGISMASKRR